jgi:hypothetical protein
VKSAFKCLKYEVLEDIIGLPDKQEKDHELSLISQQHSSEQQHNYVKQYHVTLLLCIARESSIYNGERKQEDIG